jgi:uncharacterized protein
MPPHITSFLRRHHVLTLATLSDSGPWTAHCFYTYMPEIQAIVFTSDPETRHGRNMLNNPQVSAGIALETKVVGLIRGIQLTGSATLCHADEGECRKAYLKRFPYAIAVKLDLWILRIDHLKMTDNRLGFGKKLLWEREGGGLGG